MVRRRVIGVGLLFLIVIASALAIIKVLPNFLLSQNVRVMRQMAKADRLSAPFDVTPNLQTISREQIHGAEDAYREVLKIESDNQQAMARLVWLACLDHDKATRDYYLAKIKSLPQHEGPLREAEGYVKNYEARTSSAPAVNHS